MRAGRGRPRTPARRVRRLATIGGAGRPASRRFDSTKDAARHGHVEERVVAEGRPRLARRPGSPSRSTRRAPCRPSPGARAALAPRTGHDGRSLEVDAVGYLGSADATGRSSARRLLRPSSPPGSRRRPPPRSLPTRSTSSSHDQVKNFPSTPSESASWLEKKPPSGCRISRSEVAEGLRRDPPVSLIPRHLPGARVQLGQLRVVVEHLLEVRHQPGRVRRVPGEAAPEVVVDPPGGHPVERRGRAWTGHPARRGRPSAGRTRASSAGGTSARVRTRPTSDRTTRRNASIACDVSSSVSASGDASSVAAREMASTTRPACCSMSSRRSRQASAIPSNTWRNEGMPCDGSLGKYVPAKKGLPSGVRNADSGHPPWPVIDWTASM